MEDLIMMNNSNRRLTFNNNQQSNGRRATRGNMPIGVLNPLDIRTITNTINIDTRFRNNYETTTSTHLTINLENIQKRVVSLKVSDIELPTTFYGISKSRNNTTFFIRKKNPIHSNNREAWLVTLPDGNYELEWLNENKGKNLIESINIALNSAISGYLTGDNIFVEHSIEHQISLSNSIIFDVDRASGKSIFKGGNHLINGINTVDIIFNVDNKIVNNPSIIEKQQFLGWDLGFRNLNYNLNLTSENTIISEGICMISGPKYGFISLNDKQTKTTSNFISAYNSSSLDKHIISKLNLSAIIDDVGSFKSSSKLNCYEPLTQIREYFGPVDIKNLEIKLLDEYGRIIDLNNMDWSMTIVFETLYD